MRFTALAAVLFLAGCGSAPAPKPPVYGWSKVLTLSGHGDGQTEAFNMDASHWRIKWSTEHEQPKGTGELHISVHSSVSGRPLSQAVDFRGEGHDIAYVSEDPRLFFLVIESKNVDWSITVEEEVPGESAK